MRNSSLLRAFFFVLVPEGFTRTEMLAFQVNPGATPFGPFDTLCALSQFVFVFLLAALSLRTQRLAHCSYVHHRLQWISGYCLLALGAGSASRSARGGASRAGRAFVLGAVRWVIGLVGTVLFFAIHTTHDRARALLRRTLPLLSGPHSDSHTSSMVRRSQAWPGSS